MPTLPSVDETITGYEAVSWAALLGPKALPENIVTRWNRDIERILQLPDIRQRMAADGMEPAGGSPARLSEVLKRDVGKWQKLVDARYIRVPN